MNEAQSNTFDALNAAALCDASANAYLGRSDISCRATDTHVSITESETDMIIAFRGTANLRNWLTDLDCAWDLEDGCRIHRGFARAMDSVESQISAAVFSRVEGRRIWLTGHSLGGALAMLYGWRFFNAHLDAPFAGIYTFGQPRVGNAAFRDVYNFTDELFGVTFRVVHADDVVARVPWLLGKYRHAGHEVFFTEANEGNEGVAAATPCLVDAGLLRKLPWDVRNAWRELRRGKVALLADHHVNTYVELLRVSSFASEEKRVSAEECSISREPTFENETSSPRPSPPQVCGGEGDGAARNSLRA